MYEDLSHNGEVEVKLFTTTRPVKCCKDMKIRINGNKPTAQPIHNGHLMDLLQSDRVRREDIILICHLRP